MAQTKSYVDYVKEMGRVVMSHVPESVHTRFINNAVTLDTTKDNANDAFHIKPYSDELFSNIDPNALTDNGFAGHINNLMTKLKRENLKEEDYEEYGAYVYVLKALVLALTYIKFYGLNRRLQEAEANMSASREEVARLINKGEMSQQEAAQLRQATEEDKKNLELFKKTYYDMRDFGLSFNAMKHIYVE